YASFHSGIWVFNQLGTASLDVFAFIVKRFPFSCAASVSVVFRIYRETLSRFRTPLQAPPDKDIV
ncbi:hypothetical protein, partial [Pedobacter steynii]